MDSQSARVLDQVGVRVPGVDDYSSGAGVVEQDGDFVVVGFGLGEGVVQDDIDDVRDGFVGVQFGDADPVLVRVEHVGHAEHDNVVVVNQRDGDGRAAGRWEHNPDGKPPLGCAAPSLRVL